MENKPNNEISELLARLQKKVEKKSEPKVDSAKPNTGGETPEELLDLLKKNIGATEEDRTASKYEEYSIAGYELDENVPNETESEEVSFELEQTEEKEEHSREEEEILQSRVETLVSEAVEAEEVWSLPQMSEKIEPQEVCEEPMQVEEIIAEELAAAEPESLSENEEMISEEAGNISETVETKEEMPAEPDELPIAEETEEVQEEDNGSVILFETQEEAYEEELEDEYTELYLNEPDVKRFFRFRRMKTETGENKHEPVNSPNFDDIDINLALALGNKEALENSVGYARVRAAKNGFYDPFLEESSRNRTYGFSGEEFRNDGHTETIKKRYATEYRSIKKSFIATCFLSVLILFLELLPKTAIKIPYFSELLAMPTVYYGAAVLFSVLLILFSLKKMIRGLRACFLLQSEPYAAVSVLAALNLVYHVIVLLFLRESGLPAYNFAMSVFLLFFLADDGMRLIREKLAFDVASDRKPKLSLEKLENTVREETAGLSAKQDFFVEKVTLVGNFFTRFGRRSLQLTEFCRELAFSALGAILISVLSIYVTHDISMALTAFVFSIFMCVPMQFLTVSAYPFYHLTKGLSKLDSAVIGDAVTEEYHDADTIYLEDAEMFGKHGARVVGIRVYNDIDFYEILSYANSVFHILGAPLCNVFDNSAKEIETKGNVKITGIAMGGVEAIVDLKTVCMGNLAFMRSRGYFPKRNPDDERKTESGEVNILYLAIGGDLCAKIYMQYTVTQRFEKFAAEMLKNGVHVGIRTLDPNVNEKMIATLRQDKNVSIKVIRPTPNELIPVGKHSDSGIVTAKNSHMVFKILAQCFNIKQIHGKQRMLRRIALLVGAVLSALLMVSKLYASVSSLYIVIYQLLWVLPVLIYTKSKLK